MMSSIHDANTRVWLETAEDDGKEWETAIDICVGSFMDSAAYKRSHSDPAKRRIFLKLYFNYLYETEWSNGRSSLTCLKMQRCNKSKEKIVYVCCHQLFGEQFEVDDTEIKAIDKAGFDLCFEQDRWADENIHKPMKEAARELGTSLIYGCFHAVAEEFMNQGIGRKYTFKAVQMNYMNLTKRLGMEDRLGSLDKQPPILYGLLDDIRTRRFQIDVGYLELGHLHLNQVPGLKCADDDDYRKGDETSCIFVSVWASYLRDFSIPVIKKKFLIGSRL